MNPVQNCCAILRKRALKAQVQADVTVCSSVSFIFTVFLLGDLSLLFNWVKSEDFDHSAERETCLICRGKIFIATITIDKEYVINIYE